MKKSLELALKIRYVGAQENNNLRILKMDNMPNNIIDTQGNILLRDECYGADNLGVRIPYDNPAIIHRYKDNRFNYVYWSSFIYTY